MLLVLDWTRAGVPLIGTTSGGTNLEVGHDSTIISLGAASNATLGGSTTLTLGSGTVFILGQWQASYR